MASKGIDGASGEGVVSLFKRLGQRTPGHGGDILKPCAERAFSIRHGDKLALEFKGEEAVGRHTKCSSGGRSPRETGARALHREGRSRS